MRLLSARNLNEVMRAYEITERPPVREEFAGEVAHRISTALGPGWSPAAQSTLLLTFSGALMAAHFSSYHQIAQQLEDAVNLILGAAVG